MVEATPIDVDLMRYAHSPDLMDIAGKQKMAGVVPLN